MNKFYKFLTVLFLSCLVTMFVSCSHSSKTFEDGSEFEELEQKVTSMPYDPEGWYSYVHLHSVSGKFYINAPNKSWDGKLEHYTTSGWKEWKGGEISSRSYGYTLNGKRYTQAILIRGSNNTTITQAKKENAWKFRGAKIEVVGGGLSSLLNYRTPHRITANEFAYLFNGVTTIDRADLANIGYTMDVAQTEPINIDIQSISISKTSAVVKAGDTIKLSCNVVASPDSADNRAVVWSSSSTDYAEAEADGTIHIHKPGTVKISVRSAINSSKVASCNLTIVDKNVKINSVTLDKTSAQIKAGETVQLSATVSASPADAINKIVEWTSSDTSIADVSQAGVVTAKNSGTVTITAKSPIDTSKSASCTITIEAGAPEEEVTPVNPGLDEKRNFPLDLDFNSPIPEEKKNNYDSGLSGFGEKVFNGFGNRNYGNWILFASDKPIFIGLPLENPSDVTVEYSYDASEWFRFPTTSDIFVESKGEMKCSAEYANGKYGVYLRAIQNKDTRFTVNISSEGNVEVYGNISNLINYRSVDKVVINSDKNLPYLQAVNNTRIVRAPYIEAYGIKKFSLRSMITYENLEIFPELVKAEYASANAFDAAFGLIDNMTEGPKLIEIGRVGDKSLAFMFMGSENLQIVPAISIKEKDYGVYWWQVTSGMFYDCPSLVTLPYIDNNTEATRAMQKQLNGREIKYYINSNGEFIEASKVVIPTVNSVSITNKPESLGDRLGTHLWDSFHSNHHSCILTGQSIQLNATVDVTPSTANKEFVWYSSDSSIVDVTDDGIVTAHKPGFAEIFVYSKLNDKISDSIVFVSVEIKPITLPTVLQDFKILGSHTTTSNDSSPEMLVINFSVGDTVFEDIKKTNTDATRKLREYTLTSSNPSVISIKELLPGYYAVTAEAIGKSTLTFVSTIDPSVKASFDFNISENVSVTNISASADKNYVKKGEQLRISADIDYDKSSYYASITRNNNTWKSSDESIVKIVDKNEKSRICEVEGVSNGKAIITVTNNFDSSKSASFTVYCNEGTVVNSMATSSNISGDKYSPTKIDIGNTMKIETIGLSVSPNTEASNLMRYKVTTDGISSSANVKAVTVSSDGVITAKEKGKVCIIISPAADDSKSLRVYVEVTNNSAVESVSIDKSSATLQIGNELTLNPTVKFANGITDSKDIRWSIDDKNVISWVRGNTFKACGIGTTTVTATSSADNTKFAKCQITVNVNPNLKVNKFVSAKGNASLAEPINATVGKTYSISPKDYELDVYPNTNANMQLEWYTSDAKVAYVNYLGEVIFLNEGSVVITGVSRLDKSKSVSFKFNVGVSFSIFSINKPILYDDKNPQLQMVGDTFALSSFIVASKDDYKYKKAIWSSSDTSIVKVDASTGSATAVGQGEAIITLTSSYDSSLTDSIKIKVLNDDVEIFRLNKNAISLYPKEYGRLSLDVLTTRDKHFNYNVARQFLSQEKDFDISCSDNSVVKYTRISGHELYFLGMKPGKATITVTSKLDRSKSSTCEITVVDEYKSTQNYISLTSSKQFKLMRSMSIHFASMIMYGKEEFNDTIQASTDGGRTWDNLTIFDNIKEDSNHKNYISDVVTSGFVNGKYSILLRGDVEADYSNSDIKSNDSMGTIVITEGSDVKISGDLITLYRYDYDRSRPENYVFNYAYYGLLGSSLNKDKITDVSELIYPCSKADSNAFDNFLAGYDSVKGNMFRTYLKPKFTSLIDIFDNLYTRKSAEYYCDNAFADDVYYPVYLK